MKPYAKTLLAAGGALLVIGASLELLGDDSVFTSPPEAVTEGFVREVEQGRYERARPYLEDDLAERATAEVLEGLAHRLRSRTGTILDVAGEPVWKRQGRAVAAARVEGEQSGSILLRFPLRFASGVWSIAGLGDLADTMPASGPGETPAADDAP